MNEFVYATVMSAELQLFLKAIGGVITGILISSGHLPSVNQDAFAQNIDAVVGGVVTVISGFYILEHAFQSAKEELKWSYTPDTTPKVTATTPEVTPPVTPTQPAA